MTGEIPLYTQPGAAVAGRTHGAAAAVGLVSLLVAGCTLVAASPVATLAWHVGVMALLAACLGMGAHACACAFARLRVYRGGNAGLAGGPRHQTIIARSSVHRPAGGGHPATAMPTASVSSTTTTTTTTATLQRDRVRSYDRPGWRSVFDVAAELRLACACAAAGPRRSQDGPLVSLCMPPAPAPLPGWAPWAFWGDVLHTRAVLATVVRQALHAAGPGPWPGPLHMAVRVDTARQVVVHIQPFGCPCDLARQGRCAPVPPSSAGGVETALLVTAILPMHCPPGAVRERGCCTLQGCCLGLQGAAPLPEPCDRPNPPRSRPWS